MRYGLLAVLLLAAVLAWMGARAQQQPQPVNTDDLPNVGQYEQPDTEAGERLDPGLPPYQPPTGEVTGTLKIVGTSDTLTLPKYLSLALQNRVLGATVSSRTFEQGAGINWWYEPNTVALFENPMSEEALAAFEREQGFRPLVLPVALSAVAVIVHPDNPVVQRGLTLAELDAIYSSTQYRGHEDIRFWGDLVDEEVQTRPIVLYGPTQDSHLYHYMQRRVLKGGDYKPGLVRIPEGTDRVVQQIGGEYDDLQAPLGDVNGIGFIHAHELNSRVAAVPLADGQSEPVVLEPKTLFSMAYPLTNYIYLYINRPPGQPLAPLELELVRFVYSNDGQSLIVESDKAYVPLPRELIDRQLARTGLNAQLSTLTR